MEKTTLVPARFAAVASIALLALAGLAQAQPAAPVPPAIEKAAREIATELARDCPVAPAGDTPAYNACRRALFGPSALRSHLPDFLLWGRQSKVSGATLRQTNLTQFAPDVWTNMYA